MVLILGFWYAWCGNPFRNLFITVPEFDECFLSKEYVLVENYVKLCSVVLTTIVSLASTGYLKLIYLPKFCSRSLSSTIILVSSIDPWYLLSIVCSVDPHSEVRINSFLAWRITHQSPIPHFLYPQLAKIET
jgi:hypothetical protein